MLAKAVANFSIWADMLAMDSSTDDGGLELEPVMAVSKGWEWVGMNEAAMALMM
jgi:hypothetical protein